MEDQVLATESDKHQSESGGGGGGGTGTGTTTTTTTTGTLHSSDTLTLDTTTTTTTPPAVPAVDSSRDHRFRESGSHLSYSSEKMEREKDLLVEEKLMVRSASGLSGGGGGGGGVNLHHHHHPASSGLVMPYNPECGCLAPFPPYPPSAKTSTFITLSLLYATLLVVVCLGFVLSEVLTHNVPLYYYEAFFTYLYGLSILFLLYVLCYLLSDSARDRKPKQSQKVRQSEGLADGSPTQEKLTSSSSCSKPRKHKTSDNDHSHGSFFLRIGAIAFGLGTMIYNGLEFGVFFEIPLSSPCYQILRGVNPLLQLVFTFMQMYFIFMNARLNIHKFKFLARFGLMHIVATNLCVWVRTLVRESLKEINEFRVSEGHRGEDYMILANNVMNEEDIVNRTCERVEIMGSIVSDSAPYLYPFIVEYSLIAAAVLYIMWKHIGRNPRFVYDAEAAGGDGMSVVSRRCHSRVDCVGASKGLFCGLLVLVASLICLILFFVLVHREELKMLAIYLADCSHCGIMFFSIIAIFIGFVRVRQLKFHGEREEELDDILLMVSAFGLFAYAVFSTVAGSLSAYTREPNLLVMVTGILSVLQVIIQMVFIKDTQRRQVSLPEHERTKPGRQVVTFLLICNLTMWVIYTFETQKVEANPVQLEFFGDLPWTILLRCTLPLAIFHRFHSTVVLAAIWKNSYKTRIE